MLTSPAGDDLDDRLDLPPWARPGPVPSKPPAVARGVAVRVVGAGGVALLLFLLGHGRAAALLLVVLAASSIASLLIPAFGRGVDRAIAWFQRFVGRALTVVLLGTIYLVVFMPVSLVLRLFRHDPLALGATADDPTFWREAARRRGTPLHRRPFTYERHPAPVAGARRRGGLVVAVGVVAVVALLDLGVGAGVDALGRSDDPVDEGLAQATVPDVGARQGEPWAQQLFDELSDNYAESGYHPYRGWAVADYDGEHVHVTDEVRRSSETGVAAAGGEPIDVFFFGGSTVMGWYQRDEQTIPSELVRLAEADGIAIRAVNYGQPAYQNWQEVLLLQERLSAGDVPDLAVFYDGANEIGTQFRSGPSTDPTHIQAREVEERLDTAGEAVAESSPLDRFTSAYADTSAVAKAARALQGEDAPGLWSPWPDQMERPADRGRAAAEVHARGVDLAEKLSESYGFRSAFFWQPWLYSKEAVPGEENAVGSWGTDPEAWTAASDAARAALDEPVVDLGDALDGVDEPIMYDFVHTNERGAEVVAEALYEQLKPTLLELQRGSTP